MTRRLAVLLIAAAALYAALLSRTYVGSFNDDALYVISALSLLKGRFATLCLPLEPPMNHFLPGFPLTLVPFVYFFQPHWAWLKLTSLVWTLLSGLTLWFLARRFLTTGFSLLVVGAFLFNPTVVEFSSVVMPEPCFVFAIVGIWILFSRLLEKETPLRLWTFACALSWTCLLRQEAVLLAFGIVGGLLYTQRSRLVIKTVGPAILCWSAFLLRNQYLTGSPTDYLPYWHQTPRHLAGVWPALWARVLSLSDTLFVQGISGMALDPHSPWKSVLTPVLILAGVSLTGYGIFLVWKRGSSVRALWGAMIAFLISFIVLHGFWYVSDTRYVLPVLPFLWLFLIVAAEKIWISYRMGRGVLGILLSLILLGYGDRNSFAVYKTFTHTGPSYRQLPNETLAWVSREVPQNALVISNKLETIYLYTGHHGYFILMAESARDLHAQFKANGVRYVVYQASSGLDPALGEQWQRTMEWTAGHSDLFRLAYLNPGEKTIIFKVIVS